MSSTYIQKKGKIGIKKIHDGEVHTLVSRWMTDAIIAISILIVFCGWIKWQWELIPNLFRLGLVYFGSNLATSYVSPDCDLAHSFPVSHWKGLSWIWYPYRTLIAKKHRGILSHGIEPPKSWRRFPARVRLFRLFGFLLGTGTRLLYLTGIVFFVCLVMDWVVGLSLFTDGVIRFVLSEIMLWLSVGVALSDLFHTNMDKLTTKK